MSEEILQSFFKSAIGQVSTAIVIFILLVIIMKISSRGNKNNILVLVKTAVLISVAFILNQITIIKMPHGGSVTAFSMLALYLISYLFGARQGILAGMAYGFLDLIINPYVVHPLQLFLDYPLAFGAIGIGGLLRNSNYGIITGYILGVFGRYVVVVLSGIIFWGMYAAEGFDSISWSFFYNMTCILPEAGATILILMVPQVKNVFDKFKE